MHQEASTHGAASRAEIRFAPRLSHGGHKQLIKSFLSLWEVLEGMNAGGRIVSALCYWEHNRPFWELSPKNLDTSFVLFCQEFAFALENSHRAGCGWGAGEPGGCYQWESVLPSTVRAKKCELCTFLALVVVGIPVALWVCSALSIPSILPLPPCGLPVLQTVSRPGSGGTQGCCGEQGRTR